MQYFVLYKKMFIKGIPGHISYKLTTGSLNFKDKN